MKERGGSGKSPMEHVRFLTVSIGWRPPAGRKEERAARYMEESFREMGLECHSQKFRSRRSEDATRIACLLCLSFAVMLYRTSPLVFYAIYLFFLVMLMFELMGRSPLGLLQWRHASSNVWVKIDPYDDVKRTLVVMAPLDTPPNRLRSVAVGNEGSRFPSLFLAVFNIFMGIWLTLMTGAYLLSVSAAVQKKFWVAAFLLSLLDLLAAVIMIFSRRGQKKRGASENDSSHLAALLMLGERFSRRRPAHTRIWLVAVGSDAAGGMGVKRFLSRHRGDLRGSLFVFIKCLGRDRPVIYRRAGLFLPFRAYKPAVKIAEQINQRYPHFRLIISGTYPPRGGFYRLLSSGRRAIMLSSRFDKERSREEVVRDMVNPTFLRENVAFLSHIIDQVDREAREHKP